MEKTTKTDEREVFDSNRFVEHILGNVLVAKQVAKHARNDIQQNHRGLNEALEEADLEKLHFHAHALKGVAYLVKCDPLGRLAQEIDQLAKDEMLPEILRRAPELEPLIERTRQALDNFVGSESSES